YRFGAVTRGQARDRSFSLRIHAGSTYPTPFSNDITFLTNNTIPNTIPRPSVITYEIFKRALLAIVEAWDPVCCAAYPLQILNLVEKGLYFHETWIQYLCPWLAALVTPPPAPVIAEHLANGGLLMAATAQTFDVENPAHMAAARAIAAAIAPLNALPWEDRARA
ncbi:MAG: Imm52 family immunity protein, partial [Candidatus Acidiferrum sp.]